MVRKGSGSRYTITAVHWSLKEETVWPERNQDSGILPERDNEPGMLLQLCTGALRKRLCGQKRIRNQVCYYCCALEPEGRDCVTRKGSESRYTVTAVFCSLMEETVWPERDQDPGILLQLCAGA